MRLSREQIKYVKDMYYSKSNTSLAKELNCSKEAISSIWFRAGLRGKKIRSYYIDEDYFSVIDSKDKAYLLGVISADGCVYKRDGHIPMLSFVFHIQEKDILDILTKYMKSEYPLNIKDNRVSVQINSEKICNDLSKYNIVPRKTWDYYPLNIPEEFELHFIRGFFDGDGSFHSSGTKHRLCDYCVSLCGNLKTMEWIQNVLIKNGVSSSIIEDKRKYTHPFFNLRIVKNVEKYNFIRLLYNDCDDIKLNRKYNKCMEYVQKYLIKMEGYNVKSKIR